MNLLTLSNRIEALNIDVGILQPLVKGESLRYSYTNDIMSKLGSIERHRLLLDQPLTLGMFTPCKDGKPLERPVIYYVWLDNKEPSPKGDKWVKTCKAYQEAEKRVLFEGWELDAGDNPEYYYLRSSDYLLNGFHCDSDKADINIASIIDARNIHVCGEGLNTISDLANATQDNPIKLNESNNPN